MPFAVDRNDRMWSASNLNDLYSRFDNKCARTLDGKTPLVVGLSQKIPLGVTYEYSRDPDTSFYVSGSTLTQTQIAIELSKLESKHLDVEGGQVYVDHYVNSYNSSYCNVGAIQTSFELHKRTIDGVEYDVHLGWDDWDSGYLSYVRSYFSSVSSAPSLPPGRIHKHKIAVAEIILEGATTFKILNSYQRFDCWRVHNCGSRDATVLLQLPDGSAERKTVPAMGCRSFRRRADGTWATAWRDGTACVYFFPYFKGDVPYFAGGPPMYGILNDSMAVRLERSAKANNIANPFILLQWMRAMGAWVDARYVYDIRAMYPEYADPTDANTKIGDAIFTWGRARVQVYSSLTNEVFEDYIRVFSGTTLFLEQLNRVGINVEVSYDVLVMTTKRTNAIIRIYPIDCNVFRYGTAPYWQINPTTTNILIGYPEYYYTQNVASPNTATQWQAGNIPTWMETMRDLRRRIAVEEGFLVNYDDVADIPEDKVGIVKLTPIGLQVVASTARGIENYDANAFSDLPNYERTSNVIELRTDIKYKGFSPAAGWTNGPYIYAKKTYIIAQPSNYSGLYGHVFPQIGTAIGSENYHPAVDCAYVPAGGPWGFSSSVYDYNLQRVYTTDPLAPTITNVFGSDFWINKWGGKGGIDASVRILGQPNKTIQSNGIADDVFKDHNNPTMAGLAPFYGQISNTIFAQAQIADIRWVGDSYFNFPYSSTADAINYDGIGQFYHKIPKSAFLWNLLESHVGGWNRSVPLAHGEVWCPIYSFDAVGNLQPDTLGAFMPKDLTTTVLDTQWGASFFIDENQYNAFIANGIQAKKIFDNDPLVMEYYYIVTQIDIATYCSSRGFKSFNFDCSNQVVDAFGGIITPATKWLPMRAYGFGETVVGAGFTDVNLGELYRWIRLVDLDVA